VLGKWLDRLRKPQGAVGDGANPPAMSGALDSRLITPGLPRSAPVAISLPQSVQETTGEHVLAAYSLGKTYGKRQVVKDVSLNVRRGEAVGLLGPNGAGKTTVFYMITGLVPADQGQIHLDGFDITSLPMYRRARLGIGYLPQEASIFRGLSVEQNIRAVLEVVEPDRKKRIRA
jgi:lipopolysaccharide export system ATP-binding protein